MKRVDIVIPVYYGNSYELKYSINKQLDFFKNNLKGYDWQITIANNGIKEEYILNIVKELKNKKRINYIYTKTQGRGFGLKNAWLNSNADILTYMDVDLSTNLKYINPLIEEIENGNDIVTGSRYIEGSSIKRIISRLVLSKLYNILFTGLLLGAEFKDAQCGFKALNKKTMNEIIPQIKDNNWFFDTELLYIAQKKGYKIKEIPIEWIENKKSGVKLFETSIDFIKNTIKLKFRKI